MGCVIPIVLEMVHELAALGVWEQPNEAICGHRDGKTGHLPERATSWRVGFVTCRFLNLPAKNHPVDVDARIDSSVIFPELEQRHLLHR